ncbi:MAG: hypothetical protein ACD_25C00253G0003 [uncultured bacterium]|nr:MAG: hypothetical protein ACD_25C00253G0003 [uncultured bacterium]
MQFSGVRVILFLEPSILNLIPSLIIFPLPGLLLIKDMAWKPPESVITGKLKPINS